MVANSRVVLTTGRQYCLRHLDGRLPVAIVKCPLNFPPLDYYQLWHERTHASAGSRWLRELVRDVARELTQDSRA
jgi:DNA-binding transcriptional LysR family regulator